MPDFHLTDEAWEPFSFRSISPSSCESTPAGRVVALYPSPAGATESLVAAEAWGTIAEENPVLHDFEPDVEGLLVNRIGECATTAASASTTVIASSA